MSKGRRTVEQEAFDREIGERLRYYREQNDLSQPDLGELIGATFQTISSYETGRNALSLYMGKRIADNLGITINDLMNDSKTSELVKIIETKPILAFYASIITFRFKVKLSDNNDIILSPPNEQSSEYSKNYLIDFMEKLINLKKVMDETDEQNGKNIQKMIDNLVDDYSFLPGLPDYKSIE